MKRNNFREFLSVPLIQLLIIVSFLPLWFLYGVSYLFTFLIYRVFRYRVQVVRQNLHNAFPEKSTRERRVIERRFYRHFSDVMMEVLKLKTMSPAQLKRRCEYTPESVALLNRYYNQGKSVIIALGHTCNWEWAGASYPLYNKHQIITAYRPLRNKVFDRYTLKMRQRTGNILASMKNLAREMIRNKGQTIATALIADQTPTQNNAYWVTFLNQETPFYKGTEILSKKFDTPVFWGSVKRVARGRYRIVLEHLTDNPREFEHEGSLTQLHASFLERDIKNQPEAWLWSHRRWKHRKP